MEIVDLLYQRYENGVRFRVTSAVEAGNQVSVTLTVTAPRIPEDVGSVTMTKIFTFAPGTSTVVRMDDGVDTLALRALQDEYE